MAKGFPGRLKRRRKNRVLKCIPELFLGVGTEPLTDELIDELVELNWKREHLLFHRSNGGVYSKDRNSVLYPPESSFSEDF